MAVQLEFLSVIIPIEKIEAHYPGGFTAFKINHQSSIGKVIWYDDYLVRDGAMNPADVELLVREWESMGLDVIGESDGRKFWKDLKERDANQPWSVVKNYLDISIDKFLVKAEPYYFRALWRQYAFLSIGIASIPPEELQQMKKDAETACNLNPDWIEPQRLFRSFRTHS